MGKIIVVAGNSGAGKTTLAHKLCQQGGFNGGFEQLQDRPFQELFSIEKRRYGFHNQVDFLTYRAEQEMEIRRSHLHGVIDGGLDLDYHVFTRFFYHKGYLDEAEFELCGRVYRQFRAILPPPDLIIYMTAPLPILMERFSRRDRSVEITTLVDLQGLQNLIDDWLLTQSTTPVLEVDTCKFGQDYAAISIELIEHIRSL